MNDKELIRQLHIETNDGFVGKVSLNQFNSREGNMMGVYAFDDQNDGIVLRDIVSGYELTEQEKKNAFINYDFPVFISLEGEEADKETKVLIDKLVRSFGGDDFMEFLAQYFLPPEKRTGIIIGVSGGGKSLLTDILRRCFFGKNGIASAKAADLGNKFDFLADSLSSSFVSFIDEADKEAEKMNWRRLFNIVGLSSYMVELKHQNAIEKTPMGNLVLIGNNPFPITDIKTEAMRNRIGEDSIYVIGQPNLNEIIQKYKKTYKKIKKKGDWMDTNAFERTVNDIQRDICSVNYWYEKPFGDLHQNSPEWSNIKEKVKSEPACRYFLRLLLAAITRIYKEGYEPSLVRKSYYNYFIKTFVIVEYSIGIHNNLDGVNGIDFVAPATEQHKKDKQKNKLPFTNPSKIDMKTKSNLINGVDPDLKL